jgi:hypothetical protein
MTFSKEDRAVIERLTAAVDALAAAIKERTKQLEAENRVERQNIKLLKELLEVKRMKRPARTKAPRLSPT